jgi:hypothetical protein
MGTWLVHALNVIQVHADTIVALASLFVSIVATYIAKTSLNRSEESIRQAERVADRDQKDWRQRKWFELYLKANEAYDTLEKFQIEYGATPQSPDNAKKYKSDFNNLMYVFRAVHALAMVFPIDPVVTELCLATADFEEVENIFSTERLKRIFEAMNSVREKALVDTAVLDQTEYQT